MKVEYDHFENLLSNWFQGIKTSSEIINETKDIIDITKFIKEGYGFDYAFKLALQDYDSSYPFGINCYMEEGIKLASIYGLTHHLNELKNYNISKDIFIEWSSWCNIGCENASGEFENLNLEYFCLIFILKYDELLDSKNSIDDIIKIITNSNSMTYGEFVPQLYLLIEKEYKSFYYFFKSYIEGNKTKSDVKSYVKSKYNYNLPDFKYDFKIFPYYENLLEIKNNKQSIDDFINSIKYK